MLVKQYIRAIRELSPKAFVMENVSMLRSDVHRFYLDEADNELFGQEKYEIHMQSTKLVLLDKAYMFDCAKLLQDLHQQLLQIFGLRIVMFL